MAKTSVKKKNDKSPAGVTFTGDYWVTIDGRGFNSKLKAKRHARLIESIPETDFKQSENGDQTH